MIGKKYLPIIGKEYLPKNMKMKLLLLSYDKKDCQSSNFQIFFTNVIYFA